MPDVSLGDTVPDVRTEVRESTKDMDFVVGVDHACV